MAAVTENPGKWNPGRHFQDWESWPSTCPVDYGQETLFEEYAGGCAVAYKPYAGATHSVAVRHMCRAALVTDWERVAFEIHRFARSYSKKLKKFYYVDTRGRLVLHEKWMRDWSEYSPDQAIEKAYLG